MSFGVCVTCASFTSDDFGRFPGRFRKVHHCQQDYVTTYIGELHRIVSLSMGQQRFADRALRFQRLCVCVFVADCRRPRILAARSASFAVSACPMSEVSHGLVQKKEAPHRLAAS